jgi:ABC-2 type transport system permease protein
MRRLLFLLKKEFRQIIRNPFMLRAIIMVPLLQMLLLVPAITFEIKRLDLAVIDNDRSPASRELTARLTGSSFFGITAAPLNIPEAEDYLFSGKADIVLVIPDGFSEGLAGIDKPGLQVLVDAVNSSQAMLGWSYLTSIIRDYNMDVVRAHGSVPAEIPGISASPGYWYNPTLNYKYFMLPGVLVILIIAIGLMLAGLNLVKEVETGTLEQINVTPVRKWEVIVSKVIPFFFLGLLDLALGLTVGWIAFNIPFEGSILLFFACSAIFLVAVLGMALFFSTLVSNRQQYLFVAFFFTMIFILMSGIFTPSESMPRWAQQFNRINPVAYLMRINRMVMLKGAGFSDIMRDMGMLLVLAMGFILLAIRAYRKRA